MWDMFLNTAKMFLRGKLFRDSRMVTRQWLIGVAVAAVLVVVLGALGVPRVVAVAVAAFVAGALQPYLFKDLKYN